MIRTYSNSPFYVPSTPISSLRILKYSDPDSTLMHGEYNCTYVASALCSSSSSINWATEYFVTLSSTCLHSHIRLGGYNCLGVWSHHLFPVNNQLGLRPSKEQHLTDHDIRSWKWILSPPQLELMFQCWSYVSMLIICFNVDHMFGLLLCCCSHSLAASLCR